jgi:hypothetical protein
MIETIVSTPRRFFAYKPEAIAEIDPPGGLFAWIVLVEFQPAIMRDGSQLVCLTFAQRTGPAAQIGPPGFDLRQRFGVPPPRERWVLWHTPSAFPTRLSEGLGITCEPKSFRQGLVSSPSGLICGVNSTRYSQLPIHRS